VTPYNAQIRAIQEALAARGLTGLRVGTVDKFQGREAPVVIYSMATSSADEAPRGLEFLYDRHRLNVATSRARVLVNAMSPPLAPEYTASSEEPTRPASEATFTTRPNPRSAMPRTTT